MAEAGGRKSARGRSVNATGVQQPPSNAHSVGQPLPARSYVAIALLFFLLGIGLLVFLVYAVPRFDLGIRNQVYYVVLLPLGVACAMALFGALRSYARATHRTVGLTVELGGPVVLFALVIVGGFRLLPHSVDNFDLTVRAHAADGSVARITYGSVLLEIGRETRKASFDDDGNADFKAIPQRFMGTSVSLLPKVDGFQTSAIRTELHGHTLEISLQRPPPITFRGFIEDEKGNPIPGVRVTSPNCEQAGTTNELGVFVFRISPGDRAQCRFVMQKIGFETYNTDLSLDPSDQNFVLQNAR